MDQDDVELINSKDDTCNQCVFAKNSVCPEWAMSECSGTNKVWKLKNQSKDNDNITTKQAIGYGIFGCAVLSLIAILTFALNVLVTAWIIKHFVNL